MGRSNFNKHIIKTLFLKLFTDSEWRSSQIANGGYLIRTPNSASVNTLVIDNSYPTPIVPCHLDSSSGSSDNNNNSNFIGESIDRTSRRAPNFKNVEDSKISHSTEANFQDSKVTASAPSFRLPNPLESLPSQFPFNLPPPFEFATDDGKALICAINMSLIL